MYGPPGEGVDSDIGGLANLLRREVVSLNCRRRGCVSD